MLNETLTALKSGERREVSKLTIKLTLVLESSIVIEEIMTDILRFDGHLRLSKDMVEDTIANNNCEQVIKNRLQITTPTNIRKYDS